MSDEQELAHLVPLAQNGDERALDEILRICYPKVLRYARSRIVSGFHPTAEDVAQEICLGIATSLKNYVDRGRPFMAFVYGIASNKVADAIRAYSRDRSTPTDEVPETEVVTDTPESYALAMDSGNRIMSMLDVLTRKAREIIILRVVMELSVDETAEIVGSTPGAVRVAQHRALATLRKRLPQEHKEL